ncbi:MAG: thioredoxin family protein [Chromatiaceae bacterium]|nr:thioredoxin family protein [Chromatiaceae bacterium]
MSLLCAPLGLEAAIPWRTVTTGGEVEVHLYLFWSKGCPHCQAALPFAQSLARDYPWLRVHGYELTADRAHVERYITMAAELGAEARAVPAFFVCGHLLTGFDGPKGRGREILALAQACREHAPALGLGDGEQELHRPLSLSLPGELSWAPTSLALFTLMIAGLDALNPCAFFVLLFLLSLLVHARSRARMLLIGMTFVLCSGLLYFLFMAAWLNLFLVVIAILGTGATERLRQRLGGGS